MNYVLIQKVDDESNQVPFEIYLNEKVCFIGRKFQKCLEPFQRVSREHAVILNPDSPNTIFLVDLNSTDGTFVNSVKIGNHRKTLNVGDIINFGSNETEGFTCILQQKAIDLTDDEVQSTDNFIINSNSGIPTSVNSYESSKKYLTADINLISNPCIEISKSSSELISESYMNCNTHVQTLNVIKPLENNISSTNTNLQLKDYIYISDSTSPRLNSDSLMGCNSDVQTAKNEIEPLENCTSSINTELQANKSVIITKIAPELVVGSLVNYNSDVQASANINEALYEAGTTEICMPSTSCSLRLSGMKGNEHSLDTKKSHSKNVTLVSKKCFNDKGFPTEQLQMLPIIALEKCDSPHFQWPSDVQNLFNKPIGQLVDKDYFVHKRKKRCNPLQDSDEDDMINSFVNSKVVDSQKLKGRGMNCFKNISRCNRGMSSHSEGDYNKELSLGSSFNKKLPDKVANHSQILKTFLISDKESNFNFMSPLHYVQQELADDENIFKVLCEGKKVVRDHEGRTEKFVNGEETKTANFEENNVKTVPIVPDLILECSDGSESNDEWCVKENSSIIIRKRDKIYNSIHPASKEFQLVDKSVRRTLLTELKPMKQRPSKIRTRKECKKVEHKRLLLSKAKEVTIPTKKLGPKAINVSKSSDDKVMHYRVKYATDLECCFSKDNVRKKKAPTVKIRSERVSSRLSNFLKDLEQNETKLTTAQMKALHNRVGKKNVLEKLNNDLLINASQDKHKSSKQQNINNSEEKQTEIASKQKRENVADNYFEISFLRLIKKLIQLQPDWLKQQAITMSKDQLSENILSKLCEYLPKQVTEKCTYLPLHFKSYHHYVSLFYPLIILEIWENVFRELKEVFKSKKTYNKFYFCILSHTTKNDYIELECESVVNENKSYCPCEGCLVAIDIKVDFEEPQTYFGYITKHEIKNLDLISNKSSKWDSLPKEWLTGAKQWKFCVYLQKKKIPFITEYLMVGNGICSLQSKIGQVDALKNMKTFPLLDNILRPNLEAFEVKYSNSTPIDSDFQLFTDSYSQMTVINRIYSEIHSSLTPKIILVQGAPGTGKTHTIISLLGKLVFEGRSKKILVVARSNAAVDVIGSRLIDLNEQYNWKSSSIDFVCIGSHDKISKKMHLYLLDTKAKVLHNKTVERESKLNTKQFCTHNDYQNEDTMLDYYKTVLRECNIVLTTVNGITPKIGSLMCEIFKSNPDMHFSCCIVDESTQCTEMEILQPLVYDINKLILFADEKQLPVTVNSNLARTFGYERSLFQRFNQFFKLHFDMQAFTLKEQFRMHSEICLFPAEYIYSREQLYTQSCTDDRCKDFPLKPYFMLDIQNSKNLSMSFSNHIYGEISNIETICKCLLTVIEFPSVIGIICLYSEHCSMYANALYQNRSYWEIKIGTVDDFQGSEKDVIILSGIQTNSKSNDMFASNRNLFNVALTRAKKCLIICCNIKLIKQNFKWNDLLNNAKQRKVCFPVNSSKDIPKIFENNMKKKS